MKQRRYYKRTAQKPYCCVPACISMILDRRKIKHENQEEIGYELGLVVPEEKRNAFTKVRTGKKPSAGYGTQVSKKEYSINRYFLKNNIGLKETYYPTKSIRHANEFIIKNLENDNDIIACFNNQQLYGEGDWGHVSLIQSINKDIVALIDPRTDLLIREVNLEKLVKAMEYHGKKNRGGFWVISDKVSLGNNKKRGV